MSLLDRLRRMAGRSGPAGRGSPAPAGSDGSAATVEAEYQRRLLELHAIRRSTADVMATRKRMESQVDEVRRAVERLQTQAAAAAAQAQDGLARAALRESLDTERRLAKRQATIDGLRRHERQLTDASARLEVLLEDYRTRLDTAGARSSAADGTDQSSPGGDLPR